MLTYVAFVPKNRLDAEKRRATIIEAALPLFASKGFAGVLTKELAQAAGISEALLYKHFPSKQAIYEGILALGRKEAGRDHGRWLDSPPSTQALIQQVHGRVSRFFPSHATRKRSTKQTRFENLVRLLLHSLTEDGELARLVFNTEGAGDGMKSFKACYQAAVRAGDLVGGRVNVRNAFWFIHHVSLCMVASHLAGEPVLPYAGNHKGIVREAVIFVLRGMGLKEQIILEKYDPDALDREMGSAPTSSKEFTRTTAARHDRENSLP